jgi:hypothetical protein
MEEKTKEMENLTKEEQLKNAIKTFQDCFCSLGQILSKYGDYEKLDEKKVHKEIEESIEKIKSALKEGANPMEETMLVCIGSAFVRPSEYVKLFIKPSDKYICLKNYANNVAKILREAEQKYQKNPKQQKRKGGLSAAKENSDTPSPATKKQNVLFVN